MGSQKAITQRWRQLGITTKFSLAFGAPLALIVLIAIAGIMGLGIVGHEIETTIVTSTEIQRLVLEMDVSLQETRRLERDFFLRYPTVGYATAYELYARPADAQIEQIRAFNAELRDLVSGSSVSDAWRESGPNLNLYLSAASRHSATVEEVAELVARLAADDTGLQARLAHYSNLLEDILEGDHDPGLMVLFREMQSFEKDYLMGLPAPAHAVGIQRGCPLARSH